MTSVTCDNKISKGRSRFHQLHRLTEEFCPGAEYGPLLDFGCGAGNFTLAALERGWDAWGIDRSAGKLSRYRRLLMEKSRPRHWRRRFLMGDGAELPLAADRFSAVTSWYVLEHIENVPGVLRELVRVTRPGGLIILKAQDARNGWEGHYKIPWVPFLSGHLVRVWLETFGLEIDPQLAVYPLTQPQVITVLETLGCRIVARAPAPVPLIDRHWRIHTEEQVRHTAARVKKQWERGRWAPQAENLYVVAIKKIAGDDPVSEARSNDPEFRIGTVRFLRPLTGRRSTC